MTRTDVKYIKYVTVYTREIRQNRFCPVDETRFHKPISSTFFYFFSDRLKLEPNAGSPSNLVFTEILNEQTPYLSIEIRVLPTREVCSKK